MIARKAPVQIRAIYRSARKGAVRRKIPFSITYGDLDVVWAACGGKCEVTGIPFDLTPAKDGVRRAFAPSLDRKDSSAGYELSNVRFVCVAVNYAMNVWGEDVLMAIVFGMYNAKRVGEKYRTGKIDGVIPPHIRAVKTRHGIRFRARVRPTHHKFGKDLLIGTFETVAEAVEARERWLKEANSASELPQRPAVRQRKVVK